MGEAEEDILVGLKKSKDKKVFLDFLDEKIGLAGLHIMILLQKAHNDISYYNDDGDDGESQKNGGKYYDQRILANVN